MSFLSLGLKRSISQNIKNIFKVFFFFYFWSYESYISRNIRKAFFFRENIRIFLILGLKVPSPKTYERPFWRKRNKFFQSVFLSFELGL